MLGGSRGTPSTELSLAGCVPAEPASVSLGGGRIARGQGGIKTSPAARATASGERSGQGVLWVCLAQAAQPGCSAGPEPPASPRANRAQKAYQTEKQTILKSTYESADVGPKSGVHFSGVRVQRGGGEGEDEQSRGEDQPQGSLRGEGEVQVAAAEVGGPLHVAGAGPLVAAGRPGGPGWAARSGSRRPGSTAARTLQSRRLMVGISEKYPVEYLLSVWGSAPGERVSSGTSRPATGR
jgi:hypothetical protein